MPELEFGVPAQGSPPGTCTLDTLRGHVLLGGVEGAWTVEIARDRNWGARVWPAGSGNPTVVRPVEVAARPSVEPETELIETMIWAAQQAHRDLAGGPPEPETHRVGYEAEDAVRDAQACGVQGGTAHGCTAEKGHAGPHSWQRGG